MRRKADGAQKMEHSVAVVIGDSSTPNATDCMYSQLFSISLSKKIRADCVARPIGNACRYYSWLIFGIHHSLIYHY